MRIMMIGACLVGGLFFVGCGDKEPVAGDDSTSEITAENMDDYLHDLEDEIAAEEAAIERGR